MSTYPEDVPNPTSFWNTLEAIPLNLTQKLKKGKINSYLKKNQNLKRHLTKFISPTPQPTTSSSSYSNYKFSETLKRLSEYKDEKIKIVNIVEVNQTKNEMKGSIINLQKQFLEESDSLTKQRDAMYDKLNLSSKAASNITESLLTQNNVCRVFNIVVSDPEFLNDPEDLFSEVKALKEDFQRLNEKSRAMRIVHNEYEEEALCALKKVESADQELERIKNSHEALMVQLERKILNKEKKIKQEISLIKASFDTYKLKISQEMVIRSLLEKRQQEFINELMSELGNMKMVLQHPTLRMKTYERLKESHGPTEVLKNLPKLATQNLPAENTRLNSKQFPGYFSARSNNSTLRTKSSLKS